MRKTVLLLFLLAALPGCKTGMVWEKLPIDGHRTGVTAPTADNIPEALGTVDPATGAYTAPNGTVFDGGATPKVASLLIEAQPQMAEVKEVIAFSTRAMSAEAPESELSNFVVDFLRSKAETMFKRKMDVGIINFGGIRVDMPEGDVLLDDIRSMFPFNNKICMVELPGKELDFLLDGGDNISVARGATKLTISEVIIGKAIEEYVRQLTAEGKAIEYQTDGRVVVK